jgi:hypothetical protein
MSFLTPPEGGKQGPEKAGPGSVGCASILPFESGFQQGESGQISP